MARISRAIPVRSAKRPAVRAFPRGERWDSNPRPPGPQPGALPTELRPPGRFESISDLIGRKPRLPELAGGRDELLGDRLDRLGRLCLVARADDPERAGADRAG